MSKIALTEWDKRWNTVEHAPITDTFTWHLQGDNGPTCSFAFAWILLWITFGYTGRYRWIVSSSFCCRFSIFRFTYQSRMSSLYFLVNECDVSPAVKPCRVILNQTLVSFLENNVTYGELLIQGTSKCHKEYSLQNAKTESYITRFHNLI